MKWDLWIGPAAYRPYNPAYHPQKWRAWIDFGTGPLGDMGCHILDPAFYALDLAAPESIQATSTHWQPGSQLRDVPAGVDRHGTSSRRKGKLPPAEADWYDGRLLPPIPECWEPGKKFPDSGALFIGEKGTILHGSHGASGMRIVPETMMKAYAKHLPPARYPRVARTSATSRTGCACKGGQPCWRRSSMGRR